MKLNTHILSSELEFRNYIQKDIENIIKIIIFEDILDKTIFFYCFMNNNTIIATKESTLNNFSSYVKLYKDLTNKYKFHTINNKKTKTLRLINSNHKTHDVLSLL